MMSDYNQTEELALTDLDGTEQLLVLKEGILFRVATQTVADLVKVQGATGSFTVSGTTYTFVDGIITGPVIP